MQSKVDNGDVEAKLLLRREALAAAPSKPKILDCFAGEGHMYRAAWRDAAGKYLGIDKRFSRGSGDVSGECWRGDNAVLLPRAMEAAPWDIVDLDAYGNPWPLLRQVLKTSKAKRLIVTTTCAFDRSMRSPKSSDFSAGIAGTGSFEYQGLLARWYDDVVRWTLVWCLGRSGFRIVRARTVRNHRGSGTQQIRYWLLELERPGVEARISPPLRA